MNTHIHTDRHETYLFELALSCIVDAGAVGDATQMVQRVHAGGQVGIAQRFGSRLLQRCGEVYVLCNAERGDESGIRNTAMSKRKPVQININVLDILSRHGQPGARDGVEIDPPCTLTLLRSRPAQTAVVLPPSCTTETSIMQLFNAAFLNSSEL